MCARLRNMVAVCIHNVLCDTFKIPVIEFSRNHMARQAHEIIRCAGRCRRISAIAIASSPAITIGIIISAGTTLTTTATSTRFRRLFNIKIRTIYTLKEGGTSRMFILCFLSHTTPPCLRCSHTGNRYSSLDGYLNIQCNYALLNSNTVSLLLQG